MQGTVLHEFIMLKINVLMYTNAFILKEPTWYMGILLSIVLMFNITNNVRVWHQTNQDLKSHAFVLQFMTYKFNFWNKVGITKNMEYESVKK